MLAFSSQIDDIINASISYALLYLSFIASVAQSDVCPSPKGLSPAVYGLMHFFGWWVTLKFSMCSKQSGSFSSFSNEGIETF
ncbi:hypothetical protein V8C26DRAFT_224308 [Trichoderma gracile]